MTNKKIIVAFVGEAGAGKDTCARHLYTYLQEKHNVKSNFIVSCTTRPRRDYEIEGEDYHYLTVQEFGDKVLNGDMLEATCFNDWFYGTAFSSLAEDAINIGVFNPQGISALQENQNIILLGYYIKTYPKTRLMRQLQRENNPDVDEIIRRYKTDNEDFSDISDLRLIPFYNENQSDLLYLVERIAADILSVVNSDESIKQQIHIY